MKMQQTDSIIKVLQEKKKQKLSHIKQALN